MTEVNGVEGKKLLPAVIALGVVLAISLIVNIVIIILVVRYARKRTYNCLVIGRTLPGLCLVLVLDISILASLTLSQKNVPLGIMSIFTIISSDLVYAHGKCI